jgi:hypothetical protein
MPVHTTVTPIARTVTEALDFQRILWVDANASQGATMTGSPITRVDTRCHSTASAVSRLGVQRDVGLPECATPPEEVYALAKRRGMDFVTITGHDTIGGVLEIANRPDVFVSEELTARWRSP